MQEGENNYILILKIINIHSIHGKFLLIKEY